MRMQGHLVFRDRGTVDAVLATAFGNYLGRLLGWLAAILTDSYRSLVISNSTPVSSAAACRMYAPQSDLTPTSGPALFQDVAPCSPKPTDM
jgi:hypothetical protein